MEKKFVHEVQQAKAGKLPHYDKAAHVKLLTAQLVSTGLSRSQDKRIEFAAMSAIASLNNLASQLEAVPQNSELRLLRNQVSNSGVSLPELSNHA